MAHYRAYAVRFDGNFDGYVSLTCADVNDAVGKAGRLADSSAIELSERRALHYQGGT